MSLGVIGFDIDSLAIRGDRLIAFTLLLENYAEVAISLGEVRPDADRLAICDDGLIELALSFQRRAEIGISLGKVRFYADGLAISGDRLVELATSVEDIAEVGKVTWNSVGFVEWLDGLVRRPDHGAPFGEPPLPTDLERRHVSAGLPKPADSRPRPQPIVLLDAARGPPRTDWRRPGRRQPRFAPKVGSPV